MCSDTKSKAKKPQDWKKKCEMFLVSSSWRVLPNIAATQTTRRQDSHLRVSGFHHPPSLTLKKSHNAESRPEQHRERSWRNVQLSKRQRRCCQSSRLSELVNIRSTPSSARFSWCLFVPCFHVFYRKLNPVLLKYGLCFNTKTVFCLQQYDGYFI